MAAILCPPDRGKESSTKREAGMKKCIVKLELYSFISLSILMYSVEVSYVKFLGQLR